MRTMKLKAIAAINANLANAVENLSKGETYLRTIDGALGIITKYWNKGYGVSVKSLSIGATRPKELSSYVHRIIKGDGLHPYLLTTDKEGNTVVGVWSSKTLEDKSVAAIKDAKGRDTYPYVLDEKGKPVKVDAIKPINMNNVTPRTIFELIIQNEALKAGAVPFTEESYHACADRGAIMPAPQGLGKATPKSKGKKTAKAA